jgi:hypothetical protein
MPSFRKGALIERFPPGAVTLSNLKVGSGPFVTAMFAVMFFRLLPVFKFWTVKFSSFRLLIVGLFRSYTKWILMLFHVSTHSWLLLLVMMKAYTSLFLNVHVVIKIIRNRTLIFVAAVDRR